MGEEEQSLGLSAQAASVMEQKERLTERDQEHGSDGDSEMCGETEEKSQPPIFGRGTLPAYLGSLSRAVLESRMGAQAVSLRINHSPGHIVRPSVIWSPVTLLLLLLWIQPGWSKSLASGEAGTTGVH
jgi:hypothetical protein